MSGPRPIGVLACDSYQATRMGIARILQDSGIQVLGTTATVQEGLAYTTELDVAVYVLGLNHGDPPGPRLVREIRSLYSDAAIVVYGTYTNPRSISLIYEASANAYVVKSSEPKLLVEAIHTVNGGGHYWPPGMGDALALFYTSGAHLNRPKDMLTKAEMKLFLLLAQDTPLEEAAGRLSIGIRAAGNTVVTICKKLGVDRSQFPQVAKEYDLL